MTRKADAARAEDRVTILALGKDAGCASTEVADIGEALVAHIRELAGTVEQDFRYLSAPARQKCINDSALNRGDIAHYRLFGDRTPAVVQAFDRYIACARRHLGT